MPKSKFLTSKTKRKGGGIGGDFKRLKAKVGKKAVKPLSHTNTSFKSRRVHIVEQSVLIEHKEGELLSGKGQSLTELRRSLEHYSFPVKKDALVGFKSIAQRYPDYPSQAFLSLSEPTLELLLCPDEGVRKALLELQEDLLGAVGLSAVQPMSSLYGAYIVSGLTSLIRGVQRDALALLSLLLAKHPAVVSGYSGKILPNLPPLLAPVASSSKQSLQNTALSTLVALLESTASATSHHADTLRKPQELTWQSTAKHNCITMTVPGSYCNAVGDLSSFAGSDTATEGYPYQSDSSIAAEAQVSLLEKLCVVWGDGIGKEAGADVQQLQQACNAVQLLLTVCGLNRSTESATTDNAIADSVLTDNHTPDSFFQTFMLGVSEAFPITTPETAESSPDATRDLMLLNLSLSELLVSMATVAEQAGVADAESKQWRGAAFDFVAESLDKGRAVLTAACVPRVLAVLRNAFAGGTVSCSSRLMSSFASYFKVLPQQSEGKSSCASFVCLLIREGAEWSWEWVHGLPELLCCYAQIPSRHVIAEELALALLDLAKHSPLPAAGAETRESRRAIPSPIWASLSACLTTLFVAKTFRGLPPRIQSTCAALLHYMPTLSPAMLKAIAGCCKDGSPEECGPLGKLLEGVHHRRHELEAKDYLRFLATVLQGGKGKGKSKRKAKGKGKGKDCLAEVGASRACIVSRAGITKEVCRSLRLMGLPGEAVLVALAPSLTQMLARHQATREEHYRDLLTVTTVTAALRIGSDASEPLPEALASALGGELGTLISDAPEGDAVEVMQLVVQGTLAMSDQVMAQTLAGLTSQVKSKVTKTLHYIACPFPTFLFVLLICQPSSLASRTSTLTRVRQCWVLSMQSCKSTSSGKPLDKGDQQAHIRTQQPHHRPEPRHSSLSLLHSLISADLTPPSSSSPPQP
ncbi:unnamed protein product, partial [Chrysoparadoxa australica]